MPVVVLSVWRSSIEGSRARLRIGATHRLGQYLLGAHTMLEIYPRRPSEALPSLEWPPEPPALTIPIGYDVRAGPARPNFVAVDGSSLLPMNSA